MNGCCERCGSSRMEPPAPGRVQRYCKRCRTTVTHERMDAARAGRRAEWAVGKSDDWQGWRMGRRAE